jgi:type I restriction enzyme M protein
MSQIQKILQNSNYSLGLFTDQEVELLESRIIEKETKNGVGFYVDCLIRNKEIKLNPEEVVRQLYLYRLLNDYKYPKERIILEYPVKFGREAKRADIFVADKDNPNIAYILVELKKPKLKDGKDQLKSYAHATGSPINIWTNGQEISYYHRKDPNYFEEITDIPKVDQTLADILNEKFYIADLKRVNVLETKNKTLRQIVLDLEDEVLANSGVDIFEEVFKLIFTKLFDELQSGRDEKRPLEFRNTGQTENELYNKINKIFEQSKNKWEGIFKESDKINLSPSHLSVCVASLQDVKFFNSNLDVIDDAFEYLIGKTAKGDKGQYFTPRYVIDLCVKMMNPKETETVVDTAAGSAGFVIHSVFHVWKQILKDLGLNQSELFTLEKKPPRCEEYVQNKAFAIDFDEKTVRVARTLNIIAGDGQTNVLNLNTLDYDRWKEWTEENEDWKDTYYEGWKKFKNQASTKGQYRDFDFDVLLANPPFAGDIKETRLLSKYEISRKENGKYQEKVGRDILFIERNLNFLKSGGRMAVVLPQGRFNNSSDKQIRDFISQRCRILAVVGLHGNTFKPHTGTKTSVLFVQKWNSDPNLGPLCPKVADYPIFFATQTKAGKDNSGDKIYIKDEEGKMKLDTHGHPIIDHDLYNHDGLTTDGIAEAFIEFGKKEKLSFL